MSETMGIGGILPSQRPPRSVPVAEIFGPTIQGEGPLAGTSTSFVRFGGCDYLCSWCDSLHAVLPEHVRELERLSSREIVERLRASQGASQWVTLSGGNPAMHKSVGDLVDLLHAEDLFVAVETQGSRWQDWLGRVDQLVISPKPPSSGMATDGHADETAAFMAKVLMTGVEAAVKIVVFDDTDYEWAAWFMEAVQDHPCFLACGTDSQGEEEIPALLDRFQWLAEKFAADDRAWLHRCCSIGCQLHVLAWGHKLGV